MMTPKTFSRGNFEKVAGYSENGGMMSLLSRFLYMVGFSLLNL